jgi:hypothetical protein
MRTSVEGVLIVTIDLGVGDCRQVGQAAGQAACRLGEALDHYRVAATWAADEPVPAPWLRHATRGGAGHELALRTDSSWAASGMRRGHCTREISRRVRSARAAGLTLSACLARADAPQELLDILVKQSITSLCRLDDATTRLTIQPAEMRRRCYGLWELPVSLILPSFGAFPWRLVANWRLDRALRRTAAGGTILHVLIDVPRLATAGAAAYAQLARFFHATETLCREGALRVETLAQAARRKALPCPVTPARSILRRAA